MPIFRFKGPDGRVVRIEAEDKASAVRKLTAGEPVTAKGAQDVFDRLDQRRTFKFKGPEGVVRIEARDKDEATRKLTAQIRARREQGEANQQFFPQLNAGLTDYMGGEISANALRAIGIPTANESPSSVPLRFARGVGQAMGAVPYAVGAGQLVGAAGRAAGGTAGQVAANVGDDVVRGMTSFGGLGAEGIAGGFANVGAGAAEDAGFGAVGQTVAGMGAGIGGGMAAGALGRAAGSTPSVRVAKAGKDAVSRAFGPSTEAGAMAVASARARQLAGGDERALAVRDTIKPTNEFNLTPAQQSGDPNLMALERGAALKDPNLRERLAERAIASNQSAQRALQDIGGNPMDARQFISDRRAQVKQAMLNYVQDARDAVNKRLASLTPERRPSERGKIVSEELDKAYTAAREHGDALWAEAKNGPQGGVAIPTTNARARANDLYNSLSKPERQDMPSEIKTYLRGKKGFGEAATLKDMLGLRSVLLRVERNARSGETPNNNTARLAGQAADAILQDIDAAVDAGIIGDNVRTALQYTRELKETFSQGVVGRLRQSRRTGADAVPPERTLDEAMQGGGTRSLVSTQDLRRATDFGDAAGGGGTRRGVDDAVQEFFRAGFIDTGFKPGASEFDTRAAEGFMRSHDEAMRLYPETRSQLTGTIADANRATRRGERMGRYSENLDNPKLSATARLVQAGSGKAAEAIYGAADPVRAARSIAQSARKDKTGRASEGVKAIFVDDLIERSLRRVGMEEGRVATLAEGDRFSTEFQRREPVLKEVLTGPEMNRLRAIESELSKMDVSRRNQGALSDLSGEKPNKIIEFVARVAAARHAAKITPPGAIQIPGMASQRMKELLGRLSSERATQILIDAVEDPELMRDLLRAPSTLTAEQSIYRSISPYVLGAVAGTDTQE